MSSVFFSMLLTCIIAILSLSVAGAEASKPVAPIRLPSNDDYEMHVFVRPKYMEFGPNDILAIRCRVKGGTSLGDVPFITFYVSFLINCSLGSLKQLLKFKKFKKTKC